jgi:hypothetical protein
VQKVSWILLRVVLLATCLPAVRIGAQEPPAHFPACSTDSAARAFLSRVRYLLASQRAPGEARLDSLHIEPIAPDEATLVTEEPICLAAAAAYAATAHAASGLRPPFPVMIVRAGARYLVQLGGLIGRETEEWEVVVFDPTFRALASY